MSKENSASNNKRYTLRTHWKNHLPGYAVGLLTTPVFGLGIIIIIWTWYRHRRYRYEVTATAITSIDRQFTQNMDIININEVEVEQGWIQKQLEVGDVKLSSNLSEIRIIGQENPHQLKELIVQAVSNARSQLTEKQKTVPRQPKMEPGQMDRLNYLTGLWQQGLISDEDYDKEKQKFE